MAKTSSARPGKRKTVKRAAGKTVAGKAAKKAGKNTAKKKVSAGRRAALKKTAVKKPAVKKAVKKKVAAALSQPSSVAAPSAPKSALLQLVETALADMKAVNITVLDVRGLTDVADNMVIASGNSDRHVRSIADNVVMAAKKAGYRPMGVEGERDGEWALVDLQDIIVHVMLPRVREFYRLENLWDISAARREAAMNSA